MLTGLVNPTDFAFSPDGRVFVTEKRGVLKIFKNLGDTTPTSLDMRVEVHNWWDRGMLGVAVDPHLADPDPATRRPYVYVLYTADASIGATAPAWGSPNPPPLDNIGDSR